MTRLVHSLLTLLRIPYCLPWFFIGLVTATFLQASTLALISCGILAFGLTFELVINLLKKLGTEFTRLTQIGLSTYVRQAVFSPAACVLYGCGLIFWAFFYTLGGTLAALSFITGSTLIITALIRVHLRSNRSGYFSSPYASSTHSHSTDYGDSSASSSFSWGGFGGGDGGSCDGGYSGGDSGGDSCDF
ncbi:MAG: hypothetical protein ACFB0C_17885 [Leptolyngbyaceae cyanobacterium]